MAQQRAPGPGMVGQFGLPGPAVTPRALGVFRPGPPTQYGMVPRRPGRRPGLGETPALNGMFRAGRTVGVSTINAMATNIRRG